MESVTSADGTEVAYELDGEGPPLVLVHGGSGTRRTWDVLRPHLAEAYTLVVPDRRGRGDSGDAEAYDLQREAADLRAVVEAVDGDPAVFGHPFGGPVTLAAAEDASSEWLETAVDRLVLYEPALLVGDHRDGADLADRMAERLDAGERREAMALFFREAGGIERPEQLPIWPDEVHFHLAETIVRENRAVERYRLDDPGIDVPTLLLTGVHGPAHLRDGVFALDEALDDSTLVELDGGGHTGFQHEPGAVADEIRAFPG
ncbi:alpha/beta hydrolase [Halobacteriales archaeon QS_1_68_20]|nr:MAG: alpha/beta hydrolase [Halobacteriales archaeon QS_1_68_20]